MKIARNSLCPCGSGKKYKKCCVLIRTSVENHLANELSFIDICKLATEGLKNLSQFHSDAKDINVRKIDKKGKYLLIEYFTLLSESMDLKVEAGYVMTAITNVFDKEFDISHYGLTGFALRAFDQNVHELLYVFSSKDSADYARRGQYIEWIKLSIFNENTDEYRIQRAKVLISRTENGLRKLIVKKLDSNFGTNWWNRINKKARNDGESIYLKKFGGSALPKGEILIDYIYLPSIKDIIVEHWNVFDSIFIDITYFQNLINNLNEIRKQEGHNRPIDHSTLIELEKIYCEIVDNIESQISELVPEYLVDYWKSQIKNSINKFNDNIIVVEENDRFNPVLMTNKFDKYCDLLIDINNDLRKITSPPGKGMLHKSLINAFQQITDSANEMILNFKSMDKEKFYKANEKYIEGFKKLKEFELNILLSESG